MIRRLMAMGLMVVAAAVMAGCDDSGGGGGEGGSGASGGNGTGGNGAGGGGTGGGGQGGGQACGSATCGPDQFCDWSDDLCGASQSGAGSCKPRPEGCPDSYAPRCGCNGVVFSNECDANGVGQDISNAGGCTPPDGTFACGPQFCAAGQQYCQRTGSDVGGTPDYYQCIDLPQGCMDCACLASEPCGDLCEAGPDGDLHVTCLGG